MVTVERLCKSYGPLLAVDDVSFSIEKGTIFGLLGPNGAGKTTTINMIVGLMKPDSGRVRIDGAADPTRPELRRQLGNAPQAIALYESLTGEENLLFYGRLYDLRGSRLKERVAWALRLAGLEERRKDRVSAYSGGMKRRLNFACALVHDPPIIVLDEPTAGVDPQSRNLLFECVEAMKREGRTVIYTTHYMEEAQRLCDQVAIMDHGHLLDRGTVRELLARHGGSAVVQADLEKPPQATATLPGVLDGLNLRFESNTPLEDIARLNSQGIAFRTLHVERPDLESVFLNLTGRRLRD